MGDWVLVATLVAATLPFVASILSAFSPATRVRDVEGYFLYDRRLDIDSFLKTTVGYSLQVASIALFFYWTFSYGVIGPLIVCVAWAGGYLLAAEAVRRGRFSEFLGTGRAGSTAGTETIHGFIGERTSGKSAVLKRWAILAVSLASVIGLGGTMMAEIDYSTGFFLDSLRIANPPDAIRLSVEIAILTFTLLYVLWGGYKSAVFTDRFQVPVAYVSFSLFGFGVAATMRDATGHTGVSLLVLAILIIFLILFYRRRRLLRTVLPADSWDQLTTVLTFLPIIVLGIALLLYLGGGYPHWSHAALYPVLRPPTSPFLGFGIWGTIALIFANAVWQFIDISSLQRLQSLDKHEVELHNVRIVRALRVTGIEAGAGWFLIVLTAAVLRSAGLTNDNFITTILSTRMGAFEFLIPIFVFTVIVYMLSTISGFISALSYISYYDIVPMLAGRSVPGDTLNKRLNAARITTLLTVSAVFVLYFLLRVVTPGDEIASVLYAIYAFQIAILPSALVAIFLPKLRVSAVGAISSVAAGIGVSYLTATHANGWTILASIGMDGTSWQVVPPLASALVAVLVYVVVAFGAMPLQAMRRRFSAS